MSPNQSQSLAAFDFKRLLDRVHQLINPTPDEVRKKIQEEFCMHFTDDQWQQFLQQWPDFYKRYFK